MPVYLIYYTITPKRHAYLSMTQTYSHKKWYYHNSIHNYINNLKKPMLITISIIF